MESKNYNILLNALPSTVKILLKTLWGHISILLKIK